MYEGIWIHCIIWVEHKTDELEDAFGGEFVAFAKSGIEAM